MLSSSMWDHTTTAARATEGRAGRRTVGRMTVVATAIAVIAAGTVSTPAVAAGGSVQASDPTSYVNPFIGTQDEGNTYPGATVPFGAVQFSPDTGHNTGYDYTEDSIRGFSLVHLSGVGCGLGGFLPVLPTTGDIASTDYANYKLPFEHASEKASPGSYSVDLDASEGTISAKLGATTHTAVQQYTFPSTTKANVLLNPGQALSTVTNSRVTIVDDTTVDTAITLRGFCQDTEPFTVHTRTTFDRPFVTSGTWVGGTVSTDSTAESSQRTGAFVRFDTTDDRTVEAQTSLSYVDGAGAVANLDAEATTLEAATAAAHATWEKRLESVAVTSTDATQLKTFYSALYRSFLAPNTGTDIDGRYRGWDQEIHDAGSSTYYQNYSLWDTYRTQQQMLALLAPRESADMAYSLVRQAKQGGWAPRWGYGPVETNIMTGDPITPFLVSAWSQGLLAGHEEEAYAVLKQNADEIPPADSQFNGRAGNETYIADGYVPFTASAKGKPGDYDLQHGGSATLEYALADATLSAMAAGLGHADDAERYAARGRNYRSVWDTATSSFRARTADGVFVDETDPASAPGFHEGTAVQYEWLVQQDMPGLVDLLGGKAATADRLDSFFAYDKLLADPAGTAKNVWVNGSYSYYNQDKYNPNNEPDLHSPYAYLWVGEPWKTTDVVRAALTLFTDGPTGVTGNDDLGEMSSWAVMTSIGLYPIVPGSDVWGLSTPVFPSVTLTLDPDYYPTGSLTITAPGVSDAAHYTKSVTVGGKPLAKAYLSGSDLTSASTIDYSVASTPSTWATGADAAPGALATSDSTHSGLSTGVSPSTATVEAGESSDVSVKILAEGAGTVAGSIAVSGSDGISATGGTTWKAEPNGLPAQVASKLTLAVRAGTKPGTYPVSITVTDDAGHSVAKELSVIVPEASWLATEFTNVGIGDRGKKNADLDGQGAYLIRDLMAGAGLPAGKRLTVLGTELTYTLEGAAVGEPDNLVAAGQTTKVGGALGAATSIALVGAGTSANQVSNVVLNWADGSSVTKSVTLTDWCSGSGAGGNVSVGKAGERWAGDSAQSIGCGLWATAPIAVPAGKSLDSITWPTNRDFHVFAIASDVQPAAPEATTSVQIEGTPAAGSSLTAVAPEWNTPDTRTSYQWSADGQNIAGETGKSLELGASFVGASVRVEATGHTSGYADGHSVSDAVTIKKGTFSPQFAPNIKGSAKVGHVLTAAIGTYSVTGVDTAYRWLRDGRNISGATAKSYRLAASDRGHRISVKVAATKAGYESITATTAETAKVVMGSFSVTKRPVISGHEKVGRKLSATAGSYSVSGVASSYRWYRDGKRIGGATAKSYTLKSLDRDHHLTVEVTAKKTGYSTITTESKRTGRID